MANNFVNTITTSDGTAYDVQDKRLTVTAADAGKMVSVDESGNLSLVPAPTKLYMHTFYSTQAGPGAYCTILANTSKNLKGDDVDMTGVHWSYSLCNEFGKGYFALTELVRLTVTEGFVSLKISIWEYSNSSVNLYEQTYPIDGEIIDEF